MKEMSEVEIIKGLIELLTEPEAWIKGIRATTSHGDYYISPTHERAARWCLGGAIMKVLDDRYEEWDWVDSSISHSLNELASERGFSHRLLPFVAFNNDPNITHEDLMLFLKEALVEAENDTGKMGAH